MKRPSPSFFARPTLLVARGLLGKYLVVKHGRRAVAGKIVETEAYIGEDDLACHASRGRTHRTETLYAAPGTVYVYLIYGMYCCLNFVTEKKDFPAAVLIRAVEPFDVTQGKPFGDSQGMPPLTNGPGKLCKAFGIGRSMNGESISGTKLWIEDRGVRIARKDIIAAPRIGVDYAGHSRHHPWRFYVRGSSFVSRNR
ncbi:MAG: DNA-3-methyladenine glycosylase [Patescibacteria group bacterium]